MRGARCVTQPLPCRTWDTRARLTPPHLSPRPRPPAAPQYNFYNDAVAGLTTTQVQALYAQAAYNATGVSQSAFIAGFQDPNLNEVRGLRRRVGTLPPPPSPLSASCAVAPGWCAECPHQLEVRVQPLGDGHAQLLRER
jgi:hypothetical protein